MKQRTRLQRDQTGNRRKIERTGRDRSRNTTINAQHGNRRNRLGGSGLGDLDWLLSRSPGPFVPPDPSPYQIPAGERDFNIEVQIAALYSEDWTPGTDQRVPGDYSPVYQTLDVRPIGPAGDQSPPERTDRPGDRPGPGTGRDYDERDQDRD